MFVKKVTEKSHKILISQCHKPLLSCPKDFLDFFRVLCRLLLNLLLS